MYQKNCTSVIAQAWPGLIVLYYHSTKSFKVQSKETEKFSGREIKKYIVTF